MSMFQFTPHMIKWFKQVCENFAPNKLWIYTDNISSSGNAGVTITNREFMRNNIYKDGDEGTKEWLNYSDTQRLFLGYSCEGNYGNTFQNKNYEISFIITPKQKLNLPDMVNYPFNCRGNEFKKNIHVIFYRLTEITNAFHEMGLINIYDLDQGGNVSMKISEIFLPDDFKQSYQLKDDTISFF